MTDHITLMTGPTRGPRSSVAPHPDHAPARPADPRQGGRRAVPPPELLLRPHDALLLPPDLHLIRGRQCGLPRGQEQVWSSTSGEKIRHRRCNCSCWCLEILFSKSWWLQVGNLGRVMYETSRNLAKQYSLSKDAIAKVNEKWWELYLKLKVDTYCRGSQWLTPPTQQSNLTARNFF